MINVADILSTKTRAIHEVGPSAPADEAIAKLLRYDVGSLVVTDEGTILGIFTERDCIRAMASRDVAPLRVAVSEVMSRNVVCVTLSTSVDECMMAMTEKRVRHLAVVDGRSLVGVVSIGDVVKSMLGDQETQIRSLTQYIQGTI